MSQLAARASIYLEDRDYVSCMGVLMVLVEEFTIARRFFFFFPLVTELLYGFSFLLITPWVGCLNVQGGEWVRKVVEENQVYGIFAQGNIHPIECVCLCVRWEFPSSCWSEVREIKKSVQKSFRI